MSCLTQCHVTLRNCFALLDVATLPTAKAAAAHLQQVLLQLKTACASASEPGLSIMIDGIMWKICCAVAAIQSLCLCVSAGAVIHG